MTEKELYHHGILGMKWGIRRYQNEDGSLTAKGKKRYERSDSIVSSKTSDVLRVNQRRSKDKNEYDYEVYQAGKRVGEMYLEKHGQSLYVNWISVHKKSQGKGYANALMDYVVNKAKNENYKYVTLEVPEEDAPARHLYEKHGFEYGKTDEYGLMDMRKQI